MIVPLRGGGLGGGGVALAPGQISHPPAGITLGGQGSFRSETGTANAMLLQYC